MYALISYRYTDSVLYISSITINNETNSNSTAPIFRQSTNSTLLERLKTKLVTTLSLSKTDGA